MNVVSFRPSAIKSERPFSPDCLGRRKVPVESPSFLDLNGQHAQALLLRRIDGTDHVQQSIPVPPGLAPDGHQVLVVQHLLEGPVLGHPDHPGPQSLVPADEGQLLAGLDLPHARVPHPYLHRLDPRGDEIEVRLANIEHPTRTVHAAPCSTTASRARNSAPTCEFLDVSATPRSAARARTDETTRGESRAVTPTATASSTAPRQASAMPRSRRAIASRLGERLLSGVSSCTLTALSACRRAISYSPSQI